MKFLRRFINKHSVVIDYIMIGELIHLYLDDGMSFEENDLDLFAYRFYNREELE